MSIHNSEIADMFNEVADLLEIEEANPFRVRAYRSAAQTIATLPRPVTDLLEEGEDLSDLSGIGQDLAEKIAGIVEQGTFEQLDELKSQTPPELADMLEISGLGPKRVHALHEELGVTNLDELEQAAREGKVRQVEGLGEKTESEILEALQARDGGHERLKLNVAKEIAEPYLEYLRSSSEVERAEIAGSYRRRKETVGDLDMVAESEAGPEVVKHFVEYEDVEHVISQGDTRSSVVLRSGLQIDLRVVPAKNYGSALAYFTGSKAHSVALRKMAHKQNLKVNEYGVFDGDEQIAGKNEDDIYTVFDLPWIPPELREDRGEIEAAREGELPDLIELDDLRGDLQMHTQDSDGHASLEEMAQAAQDLGYDYIAITDHSAHIGIVQGLDEGRLKEQIEAIDRLNEKLDGITILKGVEVDILEDGSFALPDSILEKLDLRLCSIHSRFNLSQKKQTQRILRAMENPNFNILAHPTGRLIGQRPAYELDMQAVMEAALDHGCILEVNAYPDRLDLNDVYCKMAKDMGLKLAISTDAHRPAGLRYMRFGVGQARRGWLEASDVINTQSLNKLKKTLKRN